MTPRQFLIIGLYVVCGLLLWCVGKNKFTMEWAGRPTLSDKAKIVLFWPLFILAML